MNATSIAAYVSVNHPAIGYVPITSLQPAQNIAVIPVNTMLMQAAVASAFL